VARQITSNQRAKGGYHSKTVTYWPTFVQGQHAAIMNAQPCILRLQVVQTNMQQLHE